MRIRAMSEHTLNNGGDALKDVDMEDMSDLTEALSAETAPHGPNNTRDDADAMDGVAQVLPREATAFETKDSAYDDKSDISDIGATRAEPEATPKQQDHAAGDGEATRLRLEHFESVFATREVELMHFTPPPQCAQHPEQAEEILEAYLDHVTFNVKIWANFDAAENVFFEGSRAADCGKLKMPTAKLDYLIRFKEEVNFRKVRLDICSPFRTLANIWMDVREKNGGALLEVDGDMVEQHPPRQFIPLQRFLTNCVRNLNRVGLDRNIDAQDLVKIAGRFCRQREYDDEEDDWERPCYGFGEWASIEEPIFSRGIKW